MSRPTKAVVDLLRLESNYKTLHGLLNQGTKIFPVVKANAYGHGSAEVVKTLKRLGAERFCVVMMQEAMNLIESGVRADYIIQGGLFDGEEEDAVRLDLIPVIYRTDEAERLDREAGRQGKKLRVHVKVDTGMGRIGVDSVDIFRFVDEVSQKKNLIIDGILSHLAVADGIEEEDARYTNDQISDFSLIRNGIEKKGLSVPFWHLANSAGIIKYQSSHMTAVRPGIILYGCRPCQGFSIPADIKPVMSIVTKITFLKNVPVGASISYGRKTVVKRDSIIATLPIGYADGIPKRLPAGFEFIVRGRKAPLAGAVTMDMTMLDVTDVPGVEMGDEATIIGESEGESVTADDIAAAAGTISYEILTSISSRVPREYK